MKIFWKDFRISKLKSKSTVGTVLSGQPDPLRGSFSPVRSAQPSWLASPR
jgi:hypothetical protein